MSSSVDFHITVPCSSANIGPGFDVMGLALDITLALRVSYRKPPSTVLIPSNFHLTYEANQDTGDDVSLDPAVNLITRVAIYVLRCHDLEEAPMVDVHIINDIPLGRGLGSSGAAVVAGALLADQVGGLKLAKSRILDYCLMVERHPDNVAAALYGGLVCTYLNELNPEDASRMEVPLSEVLPEPAGGIDTGLKPPIPPVDIGHYHKFGMATEIRCVTIIPKFEVATAKARDVLPESYSRKDAIYNMQRIALLPTVLGERPPDPESIYLAMQDKLHQPYRQKLVPGLAEILQSITPRSHPGFLGVCLSGAGPTILALATDNFEQIASHLKQQFTAKGIESRTIVLKPAEEGAKVDLMPPSSQPSGR